MHHKAGTQISKKAFLQSVFILFGLILAAGLLTRIIPAGSFQRSEQNGRRVIEPGSFENAEQPAYPVYRWLTVPRSPFFKLYTLRGNHERSQINVLGHHA